MATTRKLLERVPEDKLPWSPHSKSMTLGGLATHLGNIPNWGAPILNQSFFDLSNAPPNLDAKTSRAEILALFDDSVKQTRRGMDKTDPEYLAQWIVKRNGHVNVAIGAAGLDPYADYRGEVDPYGYELRVTAIAVADHLAAAAELVMGKMDMRPVALIRGYEYKPPQPGSAAFLSPVRVSRSARGGLRTVRRCSGSRCGQC